MNTTHRVAEPNASTSAHRTTPLARGMSTWPASPPRFDPIGGDIAPQSAEATSQTADFTDDIGQLIDRLNAARFRAIRQNSPDLLGQLNLAVRRPVDKIICSVLDVDPSACVQSAAAAQMANELVAGMRALRAAARATDAMIVIDARVPRAWWSAVRSAVRASNGQVRIIDVAYAYPQADPSLLMYTLAGRRLPPRRLPGEAGAILIDAVAAIGVGTIIGRGQPVTHEPLVVRDRDRHESYFVNAPVRMSIGDLLRELDLNVTIPFTTIRGGDLLRDAIIDDWTLPLSDCESVIHIASTSPPLNPDSCIRCGWCFESCPTRVQPAAILDAAQLEDLDRAERAGLSGCIECGICSYVCPSRLPLLPAIRSLLKKQDAERKPAK